MNLLRFIRRIIFGLCAIVGCVSHTEESPTGATSLPPDRPVPEQPPADVKRVEYKKNIVIEVEGKGDAQVRRVRVNTEVCLREGLLEQLVTKKRLKEHEAILAADIEVADLHTALLVTGAEPGTIIAAIIADHIANIMRASTGVHDGSISFIDMFMSCHIAASISSMRIA